jgi:hypothetical protein
MPKPEVSRRIRMHFDVEKDQVGGMLEFLTVAGMQNIGYELIEDVATFRRNRHNDGGQQKGSRRKFRQTGLRVLLRMLANGKPVPIAQMQKRFEKDGRARASCSALLDGLMKQNVVKRVAHGEYQLIKKGAALKALPAPTTMNGGAAKHG